MQRRARGLLVAISIGGLVGCGAPKMGDGATGASLMNRAPECQNCPSAHKIEEDNDPSGCGVGETCNPPGTAGGKIHCVDGSTSHDGKTCDAALLTAD